MADHLRVSKTHHATLCPDDFKVKEGVSMEDKGEWCKAEWEPAAECVMVDLFFETAPPENQSIHFALGISETKDLIKSLRNAVAQSECGAV